MEYDYDYNFFVILNNDPKIKNVLDEDSEHYPLEEGAKLKGSLSSVCLKKYYNPSFTSINMYTETWWKLNKSHSFNNGNKRTSFIGVKSYAFSDTFINFIESQIKDIKNSYKYLQNHKNF